MNIGFWSCIILVIPFLIIGVLFAIFKEKAAKFVSGFNSFSKEEQALYDKAHISRDIRNQCFMWAIIMLAGALLSCFLTPYIAIPSQKNNRCESYKQEFKPMQYCSCHCQLRIIVIVIPIQIKTIRICKCDKYYHYNRTQ